MNAKELIGKAIVDVDEGKPLDFKAKIEQACAIKMKAALDRAVADKEKALFNKK
jgi:hypothetical protein